jgi:DNA-directed RNA polymerase subunit RPC12/RpoP
VALDERSFFSDKNETRPAKYACPRCNRTNEYSVRWVRRMKKDRLPPGADERDRAKFEKLRDHLIRVDDEVVCKTCGKKFEIPSMHSLLFIDQLEGLPKDEDEDVEAESGSPAPSAPRAADPLRRPGSAGPDRRQPRRMTNPSRGWKG